VGFGGGTPNPRKLSEDSEIIIPAKERVAITIIGAKTLGKIWYIIIRQSLHPAALELSTYSFSFTDNTAPRVTLAYTTQLAIPNTMIRFIVLAPSTAITAIESSIKGNAS